MPITVQPRPQSLTLSTGSNGAVEEGYVVRGTNDHDDALTAVLTETLTSRSGVPRQSVELEEISVDGIEEQGLWYATVRWAVTSGGGSVPDVGTTSFQFRTSGRTARITQAIATISRTSAPGAGTAPDYQGAINVSDGRVNGVDIVIPAQEWTESHELASSAITHAYSRLLSSLTGRVNNATFRGYPAQSVLFKGASGGTRSGEDQGQVSFEFEYIPNETSLAVGPITVPAKKGHEYISIEHGDAIDATADLLVKRPKFAFVYQTYAAADFSSLGIGTT